MDRRRFLHSAAGLAAGTALSSLPLPPTGHRPTDPLYRISLAEWSLHNALFDGALTNLDFPVVARRTYDIDAVEYVNAFFIDKARDATYLAELRRRADGEGVRSLLIMCDREGRLGDPDAAKRREAVENHHKWVDAAKTLGCHSIRVNAASEGTYEEQQRLAADGLRQLTEFGAAHDCNVLVENHGGLSSNGAWLAGVMERVDHPACGTLPDFGNFRLNGWQEEPAEWYDRYQGVAELMPYAKAVSAKSHDFDEAGREAHTDYTRMMQIVLDHGYHGYVGIEYEGEALSEEEGIKATKRLLEAVRADLSEG